MVRQTIKRICCIGAGYVGGPTMAVIADKCPNIEVYVVDVNPTRISEWNNKELEKLPIYEPDLDLVIKRCRDINLFFSNNIDENIALADMIFISVNTPTKTRGIGAGKASDLKWVEACARKVASHARNHTIVVEKSTLPVRTAEVIQKILRVAQDTSIGNTKKVTFDVLSNPEFLSEGSAIKDLTEPDRVLIGGHNKKAIESLSEIYENWVPKEKILHTNIWSSELAKLTANAFLAQRISSINAISALCEETGADVKEVSRAIGSDNRIGASFLESGPGFGGSCFKKDILNLVYLANHFGLPEVANFWEGVVHLNNWHQHRISKIVVKKLFGTLSNKRIVILGFAFKANTNDTRESASIKICKDLLDEGAFLMIHDPKVSKRQIEIDLGIKPNTKEPKKNNGSWDMITDIYKECKNSDAILILTEWDEYSLIDWQKIGTLMRYPAWLFDTRCITKSEDLINSNLNYWRIGDGSET